METLVTIKIQLFGVLKETLGTGFLHLDLPETKALKCNELKASILKKYEALQALDSFRIAVDHELLNEEDFVSHTGKIALIPPFSGG